MSEAQKLFDKLESMPLKDLLNLCSIAIDQNMEKRRLEMILLIAESRLTKYRTLSSLNMKPE